MVGIVHNCSPEDWASRSLENRYEMVAGQVAKRLSGLASIFQTLALDPCGPKEDWRSQAIFFAETVKDMASALHEIEDQLWNQRFREMGSDALSARSKRRRKAAKKGAK